MRAEVEWLYTTYALHPAYTSDVISGWWVADNDSDWIQSVYYSACCLDGVLIMLVSGRLAWRKAMKAQHMGMSHMSKIACIDFSGVGNWTCSSRMPVLRLIGTRQWSREEPIGGPVLKIVLQMLAEPGRPSSTVIGLVIGSSYALNKCLTVIHSFRWHTQFKYIHISMILDYLNIYHYVTLQWLRPQWLWTRIINVIQVIADLTVFNSHVLGQKIYLII